MMVFSKQEASGMVQFKPRFEFRVFGQDFGFADRVIRGRASCRAVDESYEVYIVERGVRNRSV